MIVLSLSFYAPKVPCTCSPKLIRVELALLHDALVLLVRTLNAVLIFTLAIRELPEHLVEAVGRIAIRITAAEVDLLSGMEPAHGYPKLHTQTCKTVVHS